MHMLRILLHSLLVCSLVLPAPLTAFASGITPDPAASTGNRPSMDAAPNGVPVVNIVAPTASGLSHNKFLDFNVAPQGVVINNSNKPGVSQLGGGMVGNPNFGGGAEASAILNEVTSNRPSSINGFTEIFGGKADYILANPNGVSINGGGFINTSHAVITTGVPQVAGGRLNALEVTRGTVTLEGAGVNADGADYFSIISRAARIVAELHGKRVAVTAGRNLYDYASDSVTPLADDPTNPPPVVGIDSSVLGGMYADRIMLVANERGVGINLDGLVKAGEMQLSADGKLAFRQIQADTGADITAGRVELAQGAALASRGNVRIQAQDIDNAGLIYSGDTATLLADASLTNAAGSIVARNDLAIGTTLATAANTVTNTGGRIQSQAGAVSITARQFVNKIEMLDIQRELVDSRYTGYIDGKQPAIDYINATWGTRPYDTRGIEDQIYVYEERVVAKTPSPQVLAGTDIAIDAHTITNDHGTIAAKNDIHLTGTTLNNTGSTVSRVTHTDRIYWIRRAGAGGKGTPQAATHDDYQAIASVPAVIAAGGSLTGDFTASIDNTSIKHTADYEGVVSASDGPQLPPGEAGGRVDMVSGQGSLFTKAPQGKSYLLETNPLITDMGLFYGSDYFLGRMGWDLDAHHQRLLGDAFFETEMVRQQIAELNARSVTASVGQPDADMMRTLMDNAVAAGTSLNLAVGVELTQAQLAALDKDIVWLVEEEYEGQTVLVPRVYLASASRAEVVGSGARLTGKNLDLTTATLTNSGDITGETASIAANDVLNLGGRLEGRALLVDASGDVVNRSGAIRGDDVAIKAGGNVLNISSTRTERHDTGHEERLNQTGTIAAGSSLRIEAGNDIGIYGARVESRGTATLNAGRDVTVGSVVRDESARSTGKWKAQLTHQEGSVVQAGDALDVTAGRDINVQGSSASAGGDMTLAAGEHVNVTAVAETFDSTYKGGSKGGMFGGGGSTTKSIHSVTHKGADLSAGGDVSITAGTSGSGDVVMLGSSVRAGGDVDVAASGELVVASVENQRESHKSSSSKGLLSSSASSKDNRTTTQVGSSITGENVSLTSRKDTVISASAVQAENNLTVTSREGDVRVVAGQDTAYSRSEKSKSSFGLWLHDSGLDVQRASESMRKAASETNVGSQLSAGNDLSVTAANDATVVGSQLGAGNNVSITAGRDVNLVPGRESSQSEAHSKTVSSGLNWNFSENEISVGAGTKYTETRDKFAGQYNQGSVISAGNDVTLTAQRNINQISSHVEADGDVTMTAGQDIHLGAAKDVEELDRFVREAETGVKLAARQSVTSAVRQLAELPTAMQAGKGSDAARSITAVSAAMRSIAAVQSALSVSASVSATAGLSVSQSTEHTSTTTPIVSTVMAGNDVDMQADRDITIQGGQVAAGHDVSLDAGRDLTVESATGGTTYDTSSMSASAGGGVKANFGANGMGVGVNIYASVGGSGSDYEAIYHRNAAVAAQNDLTTKSGADTTIAGARVQGNTVTMNVGDDLVVASRQDESDGGSHSFGVSADVMIGLGASGSLSGNVGKGESSSGWVREQTAIIGKEKVDIRVEDNTHVEGAVIAAENGNLKLDTNTLTYKDIQDHDKASNINIGVSVSGSYGGGGYSTQKSWGELLGTDSGGGKPTTGAAGSKDGDNKDGDKFQAVPTAATIDYSARDRRQVNRATIGEGTIIIRSNPDAGLEGLNRDLARAQEITRDSETVVSVYIDPAVLREIKDGFGGITGDLKKIAAAVKKALPDGAIAKSLDAQVKLADRLEAQGLSAQQAEEVSTKNPYAAKVVAELSALEEQYGSLENIPDAEAEKVFSSLRNNPEIAIVLAGGEGTQIMVSQARGFLVRLLGVVAGAGEATGATLRLVDDLCKYSLSMATGGAVFTESRDRVVAMTQNAGEAIATLASSPIDSVKLIGQAYAQKVGEINNLESQGKYDEANYELGKLFFDVSASISGLAATGKLVVSQGSKLATVLREVKGAKAITAKVEDLASIARLDSNVQFLEIYGEVVQRPLGRGSTGRSTPNNLPEQIALKDALLDPQNGKRLGNINMKDSRWPGQEGWIKMEKRNEDIIIHYVMNTETGAVDDFKIKRGRDDN
ncbi:hemagglutinin repeat-containing protein [Nitratidesulfovibrio liaohensis]|uniref:hemagglutinin repeat-containing protein n=1 Tax=Nitratidesulfovibrio liaohensis TaxID=2604158 RepID=UPI00141FB591|nr:hemagglutinin repeat-containing protein [Nitratidesulfovibrio liaohensis]NHZ45285.1 filamentous hemagglutinin N-terminal domain-containing protein [Nitratidesulfovibrio liaohensis]